MIKTKVKRKPRKPKVVAVPIEEVSAVEKGIAEAQAHVESLYARIRRWLNK